MHPHIPPNKINDLQRFTKIFGRGGGVISLIERYPAPPLSFSLHPLYKKQ